MRSYYRVARIKLFGCSLCGTVSILMVRDSIRSIPSKFAKISKDAFYEKKNYTLYLRALTEFRVKQKTTMTKTRNQ